ncbi:hypothetical protein WH367_07190 [Comamonas sp. MYb21]|uniref:hypothetical protein n=1 Tax=Comamonas sp. MYb21 TaxID=1848648 RepID=UPI00309CA7E2
MSAVLIAYDLHKLGQRYTELRKLIIETFPGSWNCLESTFIVNTTWTPVQVRDLLKSKLDANDELLVVALVKNGWASVGLSKPCTDWLHTNA